MYLQGLHICTEIEMQLQSSPITFANSFATIMTSYVTALLALNG